MRVLLLLFVLTTSLNAFAQKEKQQVKAPHIILENKINQPITSSEISIKLIKVLSDSRCPKGVNCIRAGEVKVLVELTQSNKAAIFREVIISANSHPDYYPLIYKNNNSSFFGADILPYPVNNVVTAAEDYSLKIEVRKY